MQTGNVRDARQSSSAHGVKPEILFQVVSNYWVFKARLPG